PGSAGRMNPGGSARLDPSGNTTITVPKGITLNGSEIVLDNGLAIPFTLPALTNDLHAFLIFDATGKLSVDDEPPVVTGTPDRPANANGWYNAPVTVTWAVSEPLPQFGPATVPAPKNVTTEGANQVITSDPSCDIEGNCATGTFKVSIDETPPSTANVSLDHSTITVGDSTTLSANVSDSLSGVAAAEYYVDSDPGQGNGTALDVANGTATATIGSKLSPGKHTISVRDEDQAGNWSSPVSVQISVRPQAPTGLTAPTPTQTPALTLNAVSGADSYNVYRDGTIIGSTTSPSYTDSTAQVGPHTYQVTAVTDGLESDPSNSVDVLVGAVPVITSAPSASTGMRVPFDFTITTSGAPTASLSETGNLPTGLTFTDNGDGTADISGLAAAGTAGTYPLTISATNGIGDPATQAFVLTVTTATSAPTITIGPSDTETFGVPFSFIVTTTGYPVPKLTKTGALPAGVTFVDNGDGTATISGTPSASAVGSYPLTITAKNSAGTATASFTLVITKTPVLKKVTTQTAKTGTAYSKTITAVGNPTPSLTETGSLPAGITFADNGDGTATLAGKPAADAGGSYSITVTATNSLGSSSESFTLKVNQPPAITSPANASATVGTAFSYQVTTTGYPTPRLAKLGTLPKGLSFKASPGTITGTPAAGTAGTYQIAINAKNSTGSTILLLTIVVS
ncbi:MAG TPA: putative Ig domain-containing protein, partial [Streptosporangiaceae bacterium]|nr:putative Ig domain-containing protein [Streptosporangiaceae bacterium]